MPTEKVNNLKNYLSSLPGLVIAYSGGADSSFLLKIAFEVLRERVVAATAASCTLPRRELEAAQAFCTSLGVKHFIIKTDPLQIPGFSQNPCERCYLCKKDFFSRIKEAADSWGINQVADGSNLDDLSDYRPGIKALKELSIATPLITAGFTKENIRQLSREMGLPTWNRPAAACLASRFPFGEPINAERLQLVEQAEDYLLELGFKELRVRVHGSIARIEVGAEERSKIACPGLMDEINQKLKAMGFAYVTMDLGGYNRGCFNPVF
ncbi:MAG: ATP-dependent sacrificial sulfur transferase LarE [Syntrophomonas sp.]